MLELFILFINRFFKFYQVFFQSKLSPTFNKVLIDLPIWLFIIASLMITNLTLLLCITDFFDYINTSNCSKSLQHNWISFFLSFSISWFVFFSFFCKNFLIQFKLFYISMYFFKSFFVKIKKKIKNAPFCFWLLRMR